MDVAGETRPPYRGDRCCAVGIHRPDFHRDDVLGVIVTPFGHQRVESIQHLLDLLLRARRLLDCPLTLLAGGSVRLGQLAPVADFDFASFGLADHAFDLLPQLGPGLGSERVAAVDCLEQQFQIPLGAFGVAAHLVPRRGHFLLDLRSHTLFVDGCQILDVGHKITAAIQQLLDQRTRLVSTWNRFRGTILQIDHP